MKLQLLTSVVLAALVGCGPVAPTNAPSPIDPSPTRTSNTTTPNAPDTTRTAPDPTPNTSSATPNTSSATPNTTPQTPPDRDNTAVNKRDQDTGAKTPINQDETSRDVQITADIRKRVVAQDGMSVNGKNVKIITSNGKVTLRGPVASEDEKQKIEQFAKEVAGEGNFVSEIEVAP